MSSQSQALSVASEGEISLYEAIEALPARVVGEIVSGGLYAHPRPSARHGIAAASACRTISASYVEIARFGPDEPIFAQPFEVVATEPPWI